MAQSPPPPSEPDVSASSRLIVALILRILLLLLAGWFAFAPSALPEGVPLISRIGLATAFLVLMLLIGDVSTMRMHMGMLVSALRGGGNQGASAATVAAAASAMGVGASGDTRNDAASVDILIQALKTNDADVRAKAHAHLTRLTGQSIPEDVAAWQAWWDENRDSFQAVNS